MKDNTLIVVEILCCGINGSIKSSTFSSCFKRLTFLIMNSSLQNLMNMVLVCLL